MLSTHNIGATLRLQLLDTTHAYLLATPLDELQRNRVAARHADHYRRWLDQTGADWLTTHSTPAERALYLIDFANVRAALAWCFDEAGAAATGVALAAAAAPVFFARGLHIEGQHWSEKAVGALDDATRGGADEMNLQAAHGLWLLFDQGHDDEAQHALNRSLAIAEERGDDVMQLQLLVPLHAFLVRTQQFGAALEHARRGVTVGVRTGDPSAAALARTVLGLSLCHVGDLDAAEEALEAVLQSPPATGLVSKINLAAGYHLWAAGSLARTLWLKGHSTRALALIRQAVHDARVTETSVSVVLTAAIPLLLLAGDLECAEEHINWWFDRAQAHAVVLAVGRAFKGQLALARGDFEGAAVQLGGCLDDLANSKHEIRTATNISLIAALTALGQYTEGHRLLVETQRSMEANGDFAYLAELMRLKGRLTLLASGDEAEAAACFARSLTISRRQNALVWQLHTTMDFAALRVDQGCPEDACTLLQGVLDQLDPSADAPDVENARRLLASLRATAVASQPTAETKKRGDG
jgi:predicted ATPase